MWPETRGLSVAHDGFAHLAPQPVGADQCGALQHLAVGQRDAHAAGVLREGHDFGAGAQRHVGQLLAGVEEHLVDVDAVDHAVGVAVGGARHVAQRHTHHRLAGADVVHAHVGREVGDLVDRLGQAQDLEHLEAVGPELDAGADFAEGGRLFQHGDGVAVLPQAQAAARPPMPPPATRMDGVCVMAGFSEVGRTGLAVN